ncbi:MAG: DUF5063 domain-containing protein [Coriobacteriia bacterium]|nr:DUF5063 domain-containing protein [Coriobacteriia bacterium]
MHQPIDHPWNDDFDFARFRQQVSEFGALLRTAPARDPRVFVWLLVNRLSRLYASGAQMPPYSPFMPDDVDEEPAESHESAVARWEARRIRVRSLANSLRSVIGEEDDSYFAVDFPGEATVSQYSLSLELAAILEDLEEAAAAWDAGNHDDAAWTWTIQFEEGGWGEGALSVLACLHHIGVERMSL